MMYAQMFKHACKGDITKCVEEWKYISILNGRHPVMFIYLVN
jgi:hypothetical protein